MEYVNSSSLVSTEWLADHFSAPDVKIVDASWYMPATKRNPRIEFESEHIPGAVFFDIDAIADTTIDLPHMIPSPEAFSSHMRKLGISNGSRIVVYDGAGLMSAARAWWMFKLFGHDDVAILDGGLPKWKSDGYRVDDHPQTPRSSHFSSRMNSLLVRDITQIKRNLDTKKEQILDARSSGRFTGKDPEPRADLKSGHMPGSLNLPFNEMLNPTDQTFLPAAELKEKIDASGVDMSAAITTSCGSGITACVLAFGLHLLGHRNVAVYDGSWTEWASSPDCPIESES